MTDHREHRVDTRQETSLRDFLDVVFRRKWVIISMVIATTLLVLVIDAQRPDMWESTSRVLVKRGKQQSVLTTNIYVLPWAEDAASVVQLILSEDTFSKARAAFADSVKTGRYPQDWTFNAGSVHSGVIGESNVFTISYSDPRAGICKLGCNVVTNAFREFYRENNTPPPVSDYFTNQLSDTRSELAQARVERNKFMNEKKFFGADETSRFLLNKIGGLESNLSTLEGDLSAQKLRTDNLAALADKSGPDLEKDLSFSVSQHVLQSAVVQNIKFNLQQLNMKKEELEGKYTDKHPDVIAVNAQIAQLHDDLKEEVQNAYKVEKVSLEEAQAKRDQVLAELNAAKQQLANVPDQEKEMAEIDAKIDGLETSEKYLVQQQSAAQITAAGSPEEDVTILASASAPYSKKTRDYVRLALGPLLSIIVGLGIAFFLESMDHSVKSRAEAEEYLKVPVLATVADTTTSRRKKTAAGG
ncbi:MAG TPA: Wzz/FepE/Etk N-terminal domain-containing protein [Candidatus Krumholzibacteria bacterium]|nr:Wzz/FepE/Etk N-terminal domain-containing protein [Candidatus Krumholzibacteria bacterium]